MKQIKNKANYLIFFFDFNSKTKLKSTKDKKRKNDVSDSARNFYKGR